MCPLNCCQKSLHCRFIRICTTVKISDHLFSFQNASIHILLEYHRKECGDQDEVSCFWPRCSPKSSKPCLEVLYVNTQRWMLTPNKCEDVG